MVKKKTNQDKEKGHIYLALDTCVLSDMAEIYKVLKTYNFNFDTPIRKIRDKMLNPDTHNGKPISHTFNPDRDTAYKKLRELLNMMSRTSMNKKLGGESSKTKESYRFLITPTVFCEYTDPQNPFLESCNEFVKDFCYVPKFTAREISRAFNDINELAVAYSKEYEHKGRKKPAPMDDATLNSNGETKPSEDAIIMAEASYFGANLVTFNARHFIFDATDTRTTKEYEDAKNLRRRAKGIYRINKQRGYCVKDIPLKDGGTVTLGFQAFKPSEIDEIFGNNKFIQEGFPIKYIHDDKVERAEKDVLALSK